VSHEQEINQIEILWISAMKRHSINPVFYIGSSKHITCLQCKYSICVRGIFMGQVQMLRLALLCSLGLTESKRLCVHNVGELLDFNAMIIRQQKYQEKYQASMKNIILECSSSTHQLSAVSMHDICVRRICMHKLRSGCSHSSAC